MRNGELFARAKRDTPFLAAAIFTRDRAGDAARLKASLDQAGWDYALYQVPAVHRSISAAGSGDLSFAKPNVITALLDAHQKPILFLDADMAVQGRPESFPWGANTDFAVYNWLADPANDAWMPQLTMLDGTQHEKRFWRFALAVDFTDPAQLMASGAVQYHTDGSRPLLSAWADAIAAHPAVADDETLDYAFNIAGAGRGLAAHWLPQAWCRLPWWIATRPIMDHPELPTPADPARRFKTVTGQERVRLGTLRPRPPQGPFPRDCLIDVVEKLLVRRDAAGKVTEMARLGRDLWIG